MDDYTREMMDLKTLVTRTLEKKGVLAKIRVILLNVHRVLEFFVVLSFRFCPLSAYIRSSTVFLSTGFLGFLVFLCC